MNQIINCRVVAFGNNNLLIEDREKARAIIPCTLKHKYFLDYNLIDEINQIELSPGFFPKWSRLKYLD